ncbi:hypothetical protein BJX96DRAFT_40656 [Aspergillus floccosus]
MTFFSPEWGLRASVGVFLLSCMFITTSYTTTFAFDHPLETAVLACFLTGLSLLILSRFLHSLPQISSPIQKYSSIPLTEFDRPSVEAVSPALSHVSDTIASTGTPHTTRWKAIGFLSILGCMRIALYHQLTRYTECAPSGYACVIPFFVAIYDYWRNQRSRSIPQWSAPEGPSNPSVHRVISVLSRVHFQLCHRRLRYVISATLLLLAAVLTNSFLEARRTTYICSITSNHFALMRMAKIGTVILDFLILVGAAELSGDGVRAGKRKHALVSWGYCFLGVAVFWTITTLTINHYTESSGDFVSSHYLRSAVSQAVLATLVVVCASQIIPYYGVVGLTIFGGFLSVYFTWSSELFNGQEPYPLIRASQAFFSLLSAFAGMMIFLFGRTASEDEPQFLYGFNLFLRLLFTFMFGVGLILVTHQPSDVNLHPIDLLIYEGRQHHQKWASEAKGSRNLAEAVQQYRTRYNQHPPPGFDKWYEYAVNRSSVVIDDYDQIYEDILPFRALEPAHIRDLTQRLATNPLNDIGAISIRNGSVRVQDGIKPTHAWMVLGAADIIRNFVEHLPDMDLAFNLNDEPRVAVPWEKMSVMKNFVRSQQAPPDEAIVNRWSMNRDEGWAPIEPADRTPETMFIDSSFKNIFDRYVSATCPRSSKARSQRIWDRRNLCVHCVRPHSLGQFPSDWRVASDICHQPDLAFLHGFFISPASFRITQDLVPVFSQGSVSGFSDILFPSPWNYVDKVKYEPSAEFPDMDYKDKSNDLFWIGGTSEGMSLNGEWKGIPRQRLSHLVNNNTYNDVSLLLPTTSDPDTFVYQTIKGGAPADTYGLNASVHLTDPILRCRQDCNDQQAELGTAGRVEFQSHWGHRYLFDADGAGFSGRFLPFLQSHSLPFKTGLFRQWFDSRITAWLHFVPVDVRLHGLWSTLAYFAGVDSIGQREVLLKPHETEGRWIAEEGRKWAQKAIRKEDMEIYFFRLLLEWGRLTDDQRDSLGYRP